MSDFRQLIIEFPKQLTLGPWQGLKFDLGREIDEIIICGMGGSGLVGELFCLFSQEVKVKKPIIVHTDYDLPPNISQNSLIIANSFSGNTEETVSSAKSAFGRGLPLVIMAGGGILKEFASQHKLPFVKIEQGEWLPRMAIGFQFYALSKIFKDFGVIGNLPPELTYVQSKNFEGKGEKLAVSIGEKIPLIYTSTQNQILAHNWRVRFQENSKTPAFSNILPELNHNEIAGFSKRKNLAKNFYVLILQDEMDHPQVKKRMELTKEFYQKWGLEIEIVALEGKNRFEKIFSSLILADWTSYDLALNHSINPQSLEAIEEFKKEMKG